MCLKERERERKAHFVGKDNCFAHAWDIIGGTVVVSLCVCLFDKVVSAVVCFPGSCCMLLFDVCS